VKKVIDLHTHLHLLGPALNFRSRMQGHMMDLENFIREDSKVILNVVLYVPFWKSYQDIFKLAERFKRDIAKYGSSVQFIYEKKDLESDFNVGIILTLESARVLTNPEVQVKELFDIGVRSIVPLHFVDNRLGNSCDDPLRRLGIKTKDEGLTELGNVFIDQCNKYKITVDISHTNDNTCEDILKKAQTVLYSHGALRDIVPKMRNKLSRTLKTVQNKGGVFGVIPWQHLIGKEYLNYKDQIIFCRDNGLMESVCIGTDFGAPIKSHQKLKGLFDLEELVRKELPDHSEDILWNNAYKYLKNSLPEL
jgi:microsomal dipeptidase-like Zn-dependent dipeptidase